MTKLAAALLSALLVLSAIATEATAKYGHNLGGVNLNYYCTKTFGAGFKSVLVGKTAGDWTCQLNNNERRSISVDNACKLQYGRQDVKSRALNWNDPLSWRCFTVGR